MVRRGDKVRILSGARWKGPGSRLMRSHIIQITLILAVAQAHVIIYMYKAVIIINISPLNDHFPSQ
jgi:hypothetical protein